MTTIKRSLKGVDYLHSVLKEKARVLTRATLWRIPHKSDLEDINLKLGRYTKGQSDEEVLEVGEPRSELTLDNDEFRALIAFLQENYEPFRSGTREYVALGKDTSSSEVRRLRSGSLRRGWQPVVARVIVKRGRRDSQEIVPVGTLPLTIEVPGSPEFCQD